MLLTIRKCNIELTSLSPKTRAFFHMTLDLYYSNYTNVGDTLEKMYRTYLVEDIGAGTIATPVENGRVVKAPENGTVQASLERMSITKKFEEVRKSKGNLKVQIKKQEPFRTGPMSPQKSYRDLSLPRTPQKAPTNNRFYSPSPSPLNRNPQSPSGRYVPKSPSSKFTPQYSSSPTRNFPQRSASQPPRKKLSPQELRSKNAPQSSNNGSNIKPSRSASAIRSPKADSFDHEPIPQSSHQNGSDDYVLRQLNSRMDSPSSSALPAKYKINNSKVYFREENVENLTWHGDGSFAGDADGPDESTSPKVNPYSSSFLNFLSSN